MQRRQSAALMASGSPNTATPALLTHTSSPPQRSAAAAAPFYGADTVDVLREIGLADAEIAAAAPGFGPAAA
jgi:crotonobetainyl-CoA:carnitine CoA-transferase CaiB-like acyl-CoA transferase